MTAIEPVVEGVEYEQLTARFRPIFDRIAQGAAQRENERRIAYEEVGWLRDAGFGAVRVPVELGGGGVTLSQLFRLLIELGAADSNITQGLRAHFGFVESRLHDPDPDRRNLWLRRTAEGALFGNAITETTTPKVAGLLDTELTGDGETWLLNGSKHYSTGTLYADWIAATARRGEDVGHVLVSVTAPGVDRVDDWAGFGQRLTASGTTVFTDVEVSPGDIIWIKEEPRGYVFAFYSLVLQAAQCGIGHAVVNDAVQYVGGRTRAFTHGSGPRPSEDPLVQQIVGRLSGLSFQADASLLAAIAHLELIDDLLRAGAHVSEATYDAMNLATQQAYITVGDAVLRAATLLFDVGGASAVSETRRLDRHWRNARTVANHNPAIYKERVIGDHLVNGGAISVPWSISTYSGAASPNGAA